MKQRSKKKKFLFRKMIVRSEDSNTVGGSESFILKSVFYFSNDRGNP